MAEGTVKNHVSSILSKLGVRDRTRAVLQAVRAGYLASKDPTTNPNPSRTERVRSRR